MLHEAALEVRRLYSGLIDPGAPIRKAAQSPGRGRERSIRRPQSRPPNSEVVLSPIFWSKSESLFNPP